MCADEFGRVKTCSQLLNIAVSLIIVRHFDVEEKKRFSSSRVQKSVVLQK